ncbi:MAG TPA: hypothetical protein VFU02_19530 [Polyangiaceae bacterium]|nr:hypothetical protein [Polyangiaceae bacterium]
MNPETQAFLESVREAEDPTPEDEGRVLAAVHATVAAGALIGTAAATSRLSRLWAWSAGGGLKSGAALMVLVAAAAGGVAAVTAALAPSPDSSHARGGAVATLAPFPKPPLPIPTPRSNPTPLPKAAPAPRLAPVAKPPPVPVATRSEPAPLKEPAPRAEAAPEPSVTTSLRDELAVLARAQAALRRGDGATALQALDGSPARTPQLAAERATLRVLALCAVGRPAEARRVAAALQRLEPGSLQRDVISRSCAASPESQR